MEKSTPQSGSLTTVQTKDAARFDKNVSNLIKEQQNYAASLKKYAEGIQTYREDAARIEAEHAGRLEQIKAETQAQIEEAKTEAARILAEAKEKATLTATQAKEKFDKTQADYKEKNARIEADYKYNLTHSSNNFDEDLRKHKMKSVTSFLKSENMTVIGVTEKADLDQEVAELKANMAKEISAKVAIATNSQKAIYEADKKGLAADHRVAISENAAELKAKEFEINILTKQVQTLETQLDKNRQAEVERSKNSAVVINQESTDGKGRR